VLLKKKPHKTSFPESINPGMEERKEKGGTIQKKKKGDGAGTCSGGSLRVCHQLFCQKLSKKRGSSSGKLTGGMFGPGPKGKNAAELLGIRALQWRPLTKTDGEECTNLESKHQFQNRTKKKEKLVCFKTAPPILP